MQSSGVKRSSSMAISGPLTTDIIWVLTSNHLSVNKMAQFNVYEYFDALPYRIHVQHQHYDEFREKQLIQSLPPLASPTGLHLASWRLAILRNQTKQNTRGASRGSNLLTRSGGSDDGRIRSACGEHLVHPKGRPDPTIASWKREVNHEYH